VQGSGRNLKQQLQIALFGASFTFGAILTFGFVFLCGATIRAAIPPGWLFTVSGLSLLLLAVIDVFAIRRKSFCPLGWCRQTPKALARSHGITTVMIVWGFDTGLAVTTFRVAALTWGALIFTATGLTEWWVGVGYGLAFVIPLLVLMLTQGPRPVPRFEFMLQKRSAVQLTSAAILSATGALLVAGLVT
jgi:hypothetical protein